MKWPKSQIRLGDVQIPTSSQQMNNGKTSCQGQSPLGQSQHELHNSIVNVIEDQVNNYDLLVNRFFLVEEYHNLANMCNLDGPMPADPVQAFSVPPVVQADHHVVPCEKSLQFNGDFTPPNTQVPPSRGALLSPNTLNATLANALTGSAASHPNMSRKKRRRPGNAKKGTAAANQPV